MAKHEPASTPRPDSPRPIREGEVIERGRTTPDRPTPPPPSGTQRGDGESRNARPVKAHLASDPEAVAAAHRRTRYPGPSDAATAVQWQLTTKARLSDGGKEERLESLWGETKVSV